MAPRGKRGSSSEPQAFHELGVRGRKTGFVLREREDRDEHNLRPIDDLFSSSPVKASARKARTTNDDEDSGSEDMDITSSAGPGPRTVLQQQKNLQYPIPRSRSPVKTFLKSPAKRSRNLHASSSSPLNNDDGEHTVTRKLDFGSRPTRGNRNGRVNGVGGKLTVTEEEAEETAGEEEEEGEDDEMDAVPVDDTADIGSDPAPVMDDDDDEVPELPEPEEADSPVAEPAPIPQAKKGRGRPKKVSLEPPPEPEPEEVAEEPEAPVRKRGRSTKAAKAEKASATAAAPAPVGGNKRRRQVAESPQRGAIPEETEPEESPRQRKRARKAETTTEKPAAKGKRGRKPKTIAAPSDMAGEESFMALQRGPPMPKSRGLVSVRHEENTMTQTRSGRHSYRPIDYWRGEAVVEREEQLDDNFYAGHEFVLPTIKEVVRVAPDILPSKRAPRSKTRTKSKAATPSKVRRRAQIVEEDEELEEWELDPGVMRGEVVLWEPEHEFQPPTDDDMVNISEEQIAISADSIQTSDVRDATFRFAKTLTMPFMGAGVVDLPPGSEKRPKNSRKMHMVFFVHYGKVLVSMNEVEFRISAGGTWFVPRGNYYGITNDYDNPARIFFSQACEVSAQSQPDMSQTSLMA